MIGLGMGTTTEISKPRNTSSISFDGTDDYLSIPTYSYSGGSGTKDFSFSYWVRFPTNGATPFRREAIADIKADANNYWKITWNAASQEVFYVVAGGAVIVSYISNSTIDAALADTWIHYVLSHDRASGTTLYRNGVALTAGTNTVVDTTTNIDVNAIMRWGIYDSTYAQYQLNEVAVFTKDLSAAEVSVLYNQSVPHVTGVEGVTRNGLRGIFLMGDGTEEGAGTTIYDMAGAIGDATLVNGAAYSTLVP